MPRATWDGCRSRAARWRSRRARSPSISSPRRRAPARATPTCGECCGSNGEAASSAHRGGSDRDRGAAGSLTAGPRSEEHTSELQSQSNLVCRLLLEKKKKSKPQEYELTSKIETITSTGVI